MWNKISKHIMFWCGVDFPSIPLVIAYNSQHFEPIEYDNCVPRFFSCFWTKWSLSDNKFGWVSIDFIINNAIISNTNSSTQFVFLLEWKFRFYMDQHIEKQLQFIVGLCCLNIQHFLQYKYYQKTN
jgi:hypothetical protein